MLKLFKSTDKVFNSNGDKIIKAYKATVHKGDNSDYYLDIETDLTYVNDLVEGAIIVAPTPQGEQAFRVSNPQKTRKRVTVKAYHVYYDSKNYLIKDSNAYRSTLDSALHRFNDHLDNPSPFTVYSDIQKLKSYHCIRTSFCDAITKLLELYGGHLVRDNWDIKILKTIGQDNGVTVRYAKNLKEITCTENWDNVVTKILPTGTDEIMLNSLDKTVDPYIYADIQYSTPYTKAVEFTQEIKEDDYKKDNGETDETAYKKALIADLRQQAEDYLKINCYPQVNYTLKANVNNITDIGDIIEVIDERLNINLLTSVISYDYDCILGRYTELEFGNFKPKLSNLINTITASATQKANANTSSAVSAAQSQTASLVAGSVGYVKGEVFSNSNPLIIGGLITNNAAELEFTIPTVKSMSDLTPTLTELKLNITDVGGDYVLDSDYVEGGYNVLTDSSLTVTVVKSTDNTLLIKVQKSTAWSSTNNTPIIVEVDKISISYS